MHCDNCGVNNHNTSECRKPCTYQSGTYNGDIVCFTCHKTGHRRNQCPLNRPTHKTSAVHQLNNDCSHTKSHQCDNAQCEGQIELACGCMLHVVAGAMSPNGQNKLKNWQLQMTPCCEGQVNGILTLMSPVQSLGYIFVAASSICVALQISEQFSPKARTPTHWMLSLDQILTQNDHSRSFKVIRSGVNEEPLRGYIVQYNNCGLECEGLEEIASERNENRHLPRLHSHLSQS